MQTSPTIIQRFLLRIGLNPIADSTTNLLNDVRFTQEILSFTRKYAREFIGTSKNAKELLSRLYYKESDIDTNKNAIIKNLFDGLSYDDAKLKYGISKL